MAQNILASGWLDKTGGAGHAHKNTRRRWFVLKGLTLLYYSDKPTDGKEIDSLKGMVYLPGSELVTKGNQLSLTNSAKREIILTAPTEADFKSWEAALKYSLKRAEIFVNIPQMEGSLFKRGGKGHKFQNWKKRHFVLKGNTLLYYEKQSSEAKEISGLKGWIDLTEITQLIRTEDPDDGCDKPHYLKVSVNNDKEFFLAASTSEEKGKWFKAIKKQMRFLAEEFQLIGLSLKDYEEKTVRCGTLKRKLESGLEKFFFVLTTLNLRIYRSEKDFVEGNYGKNLVGYIPLLGAAVQETVDNYMAVNDLRGLLYFFTAESPKQNAEWLADMADTRSGLISALVKRDCSITLSSNAFTEKNAPLGFVTITINRTGVSIFYLKNSSTIVVPMNMIMRLTFQDGTFILLFDAGGRKETRIEIRSTNSIAIYDTTIKVINAVVSLTKEGALPDGATSPRKKVKTPRHTMAEDGEQIVSVSTNKLEIPKSRKKESSSNPSTPRSASGSDNEATTPRSKSSKSSSKSNE